MKKNGFFAKLYMGVILFLTYVPILLTVIFSFNESKLSTSWTGLSLKWYRELFEDRELMGALGNSLLLAVLSCAAAVLIAVPAAVGMYDRQKKRDGVVEYISMLPIMIPEIILGMVFLAVFSFMQLPFGMLTLVIGHTAFCIPYLFMQVKARLIGMDRSIEEAARDLGATGVRAFFDIVLPHIMPSILSGLLLSFAMSFDDVVISIFVTGPGVNTLPVKIYTRMKTGVTPEINALAFLMLAVTVAAVLLSAGIGRPRKERLGKENE